MCTPHPVTDRNQVFAEKRKEHPHILLRIKNLDKL